jgi:hypothetical protein
MDLRTGQRVQAQPRYEAQTAEAPAPYAARRSRGNRFSKQKLVIAGIVALIALGLIGAVLWFTGGGALGSVKRGQYQAVFLTNGQVYFGKISSLTTETVTLHDIYYLQQQTSVQNQDKKDTTSQNQLSLAKLGNELHGPEDTMYIERSQVLFWENVKDDSQVVKTIKQEKDQNNN